MIDLIIFALFLGVILGLFLTFLSLWIFRVKCPKCQQLRPLKEIFILDWKTCTITGQPCHKCQQINPEIDIF